MSVPETITEFLDVEGFAFADLFEGCTYPWEAIARLSDLAERLGETRIDGDVSPHAVLEGGPIVIEEGAIVEPHALLKGPIYIGRGSRVAHGAYIRGPVVVGEGCGVGTIELARSIMFDGAQTSHYNAVIDTIMGRNAHLGGFAATPNVGLREPGRTLKVRYRDETIDLGDQRFGAVMGDDVEIGAGCFLMPGTLLARGSVVYPCLSLRGYFAAGSVIKGKGDGHEPRVEIYRPSQ